VAAPLGGGGGGGAVPAVVNLEIGPDFSSRAIVFETIFQ
jgi:hypothetical protein